jgi:hypothetical protein
MVLILLLALSVQGFCQQLYSGPVQVNTYQLTIEALELTEDALTEYESANLVLSSDELTLTIRYSTGNTEVVHIIFTDQSRSGNSFNAEALEGEISSQGLSFAIVGGTVNISNVNRSSSAAPVSNHGTLDLIISFQELTMKVLCKW